MNALLMKCPSCGTEDPRHLCAKIANRLMPDGSYRQSIECNICDNCKHEWPLDDLSDVIALLSSQADAEGQK